MPKNTVHYGVIVKAKNVTTKASRWLQKFFFKITLPALFYLEKIPSQQQTE